MNRNELNVLIEGTSDRTGWKTLLGNFSALYAELMSWKRSPGSYISQITDFESYKNFHQKWLYVYGSMKKSPNLIGNIMDIQNEINLYNRSLMLSNGEKITDIPYFYSEGEFETLRLLNQYLQEYSHNEFDFLVSKAFKEKIFKHTIAVFDQSDIGKLIDEELLSEKTLKTLPQFITEKDILCGETKNKAEAVEKQTKGIENYHKNLGYAYEKFNLQLLSETSMSCKLKGVTFDGRQEKLKKLYVTNSPISLTAEKYYYEGEPAIRIIAECNGEKMDIGNIDKNIAKEIEDSYGAECSLVASFEDLNSYTENNSVKYYAKVKLDVATVKVIEPEQAAREEVER